MPEEQSITKAEWAEIIVANRDRVMAHIARRAQRSINGCLECSGAHTCGYPVMSIKTITGWRAMRVSRLLLAIENRLDISDHRLQACHRCDNPPCVDVDHLFSGSQGDNSRDAARKGRCRLPDNHGVLNPNSKLSEDDVRAIRVAVGTQREIARRFGVAHFAVGRIQRGLAYKEVV